MIDMQDHVYKLWKRAQEYGGNFDEDCIGDKGEIKQRQRRNKIMRVVEKGSDGDGGRKEWQQICFIPYMAVMEILEDTDMDLGFLS